MIGDKNMNNEEKRSKFVKIHEKIKYKYFQKVTINKTKQQKMHDSKKNKSDGDNKGQELFEEQERMAEDQINKIS